MKRMSMSDMRKELKREIDAVLQLKNAAFENRDLDDFFRLCERFNGLLYTHHLINGNHIALGCYQTGLNRNSHGAKYTPNKEVVE
jgi:DNA-binding GntR family transcriptional regulator